MLRKSFLVLLIGCLTAFTQDDLPQVSLSGTVKDGNGSAIEGAEVSLVNLPSLSATTNQDGIFIIEHDVGVIKPYGLSIQNSQRAGIKGNLLQFTVTSETKTGFIEIFTANGRRSAMIPLGKLQAGTHTQEIPSLTAGFYVMNITLDQSVTTLRLVNSGSRMYVNNMAKNIQQNNALRKSAQVVEDTLVVSKEDYITKRVSLDTYIKEDIEIVLESDEPFEWTMPDLPDNLNSLPRNEKLPDPFTFYDGTPVTTKAQWEYRRREIQAIAAKYIYGPYPFEPEETSGSVSGGNISITCKQGSKTENFSATISGSGDVAVIDLSSGILPRNSKTLSFGSGYEGKIKSLFGLSGNMNKNVAMGWMVDRVIEVLEQNPGSHDPTKIAVSGCSGCGKGAFLVGVFSRIPMTVIVESGGGGAASLRMGEWFRHGDGRSIYQCIDQGQTKYPQNIDNLEDNGICGPWVTSAAQQLRSNPDLVNHLPIDQHCLLACIAPRYLVHFTNNHGKDSWCHLGGTCEALSAWAAAPVWNALGVKDNMAFEVYSGGHCSTGDTGLASAMFKRAFEGDTSGSTGAVKIQNSRVQQPVEEWNDMWVDWDMETTLD